LLEDGVMTKTGKSSPEVRERAVRMVLEHQNGHSSQWTAIASIAGKIESAAETSRLWMRRAERDLGVPVAGIALEVQRLDAHPPHQRGHVLATHSTAFLFQQGAQHLTAGERQFKVQFIDSGLRRTGVLA